MSQQLKTALGHYISFKEEELKLVLPLFTPLKVSRNTQLIKLDRVATEIYFITRGAIRTYYLFDVEEIHTGFFFENSFVTSFSSFLNNAPSPMVVEAFEETELFCLKKSDYDKLNERVIEMNVLSRKLIEEAMVRNERDKFSLLFDKPKIRLDKLLAAQPEILKRVPQRYIASYLEIPLLSFSKMVAGLREDY